MSYHSVKEHKYVRIYKWLLKQIEDGQIKVGDSFPTEESIAKEFNINRMTVRQAIDEFVARKMIVRKRGSGTVLVRSTPVEYTWQFNNITSFTESMEEGGIDAFTKGMGIHVIDADARVASLLGLEKDKQIIFTLRIKYAEKEALCIERSYLPYHRFKDLIDIGIEGSLYRLLVDKFNVSLAKSTQYLSTIISTQEDMELFGVVKPLSCLVIESLSYDANNNPVEVLYSTFRGDRYKFKIESGEYLYQKKN